MGRVTVLEVSLRALPVEAFQQTHSESSPRAAHDTNGQPNLDALSGAIALGKRRGPVTFNSCTFNSYTFNLLSTFHFKLSTFFYRPVTGSAEVQNAHRFAAIATSLKHSGHFFVVGSGGASPRLRRAISALTGMITKK